MQPLIGLSGPAARSILAQALGTDVPVGEELSHWAQSFRDAKLRIVSVAELGVEGYLIAGPSARGAELFEACAALGALPLGAEAMNVLRIEAGIPWYGIDMDEDVLLMEVGLDHAVSFTKGCYLGQEVVERVAARGHVNRKLTGLLVNGTRVPPRGAPVLADGRAVGQVTSAVRSLALDRVVALGYVHRTYLAEGTQLAIQLEDGTAEATLTTLPFVKDGVKG